MGIRGMKMNWLAVVNKNSAKTIQQFAPHRTKVPIL